MRTIEWLTNTNEVRLIDQRQLPDQLEYLFIHNAAEMSEAIRTMAIRGAPALGVAGAFGVALEAYTNSDKDVQALKNKIKAAGKLLVESRPTAVNLDWGVQNILRLADNTQTSQTDLVDRLIAEAQKMAEEDVACNLRMAEFGASLIEDGDTIITHCNTGSLAAVDWGTALGAIRFAYEHGKKIKLLVDETRPRFQGGRLTAWECQQYGIPFEIITDNASRYFLRRGEAQKVFFGADRVTANGDVINKVGTYMLSLAAHTNKVPVYPVFPLSTLDMSIASGDLVPIEERNAEEVTSVMSGTERIFPKGVQVRNPAFDVTPHDLITAWVTDRGIFYPEFSQKISHIIYNSPSGR